MFLLCSKEEASQWVLNLWDIENKKIDDISDSSFVPHSDKLLFFLAYGGPAWGTIRPDHLVPIGSERSNIYWNNRDLAYQGYNSPKYNHTDNFILRNSSDST